MHGWEFEILANIFVPFIKFQQRTLGFEKSHILEQLSHFKISMSATLMIF